VFACLNGCFAALQHCKAIRAIHDYDAKCVKIKAPIATVTRIQRSAGEFSSCKASRLASQRSLEAELHPDADCEMATRDQHVILVVIRDITVRHFSLFFVHNYFVLPFATCNNFTCLKFQISTAPANQTKEQAYY
jgi:hypothetical protein